MKNLSSPSVVIPESKKVKIMGREQDTNTELNADRNFEKHKHNKPVGKRKDGDGRMQPKPTGNPGRDNLRDDDGGALGRNNAGDKSGR